MPTKNIIGRYPKRKAPRDSRYATTSLGAHTSLADGDQKLAFNFSDNFYHGLVWMLATTDTRLVPAATE